MAVRRVLLLSLASTIAPEANLQRRQQINEWSRPAKRPMVLALHALATRHPKKTSKLLGVAYDPKVMRHIGSGGESTVFRSGDHDVIKVMQRTMLMTKAERLKYAARKTQEHEAMASHLGEVILPQTIFIDQHPYFTNREAVQIRQPYRPGIRNIGLFAAGCSADSMAASVKNLEASNPRANKTLGRLVGASRDLYQDCGLVPDFANDDNLVLQTNGLPLLIDGQPLASDHHAGQTAVLRQLDWLELALGRAA